MTSRTQPEATNKSVARTPRRLPPFAPEAWPVLVPNRRSSQSRNDSSRVPSQLVHDDGSGSSGLTWSFSPSYQGYACSFRTVRTGDSGVGSIGRSRAGAVADETTRTRPRAQAQTRLEL